MDFIDQDHNNDRIVDTKTNIDSDGIMNLLNIFIDASFNKRRVSILKSREE
tara:strand:+ start:455 stop:607 length:153 start_codon:yes stop_codon:yes gene_type:complete